LADLAAASSLFPARANERRDIVSASADWLRGFEENHGQAWPAEAQAATVFLNTKHTKEEKDTKGPSITARSGEDPV
jgi:hypothetical protein